MPEQVASSIGDVLLAVMARLVSSGVYSAPQVEIGLLAEPQPLQNSWCRIDPGDFATDDPLYAGGGRATLVVRGTPAVRVYARKDKDVPQVDTRAVVEMYAKATEVVGVLASFTPQDGSGNPTTIEPIAVRGVGRPRRYGKDRQWIYVPVLIDVAVQLDLPAPDSQTCP